MDERRERHIWIIPKQQLNPAEVVVPTPPIQIIVPPTELISPYVHYNYYDNDVFDDEPSTLFRNICFGIGSALLVTGGFVAFVSKIHTDDIKSQTSSENVYYNGTNSANSKAEKQRREMAQALAKSDAKVVSQQIGDNLNSNIEGNHSRVVVNLLNGAVLKNVLNPDTGKYEYVPIVQGAILLSTVGNPAPDSEGKFLDGAWLGEIGPQGTLETPLVVKRFKYDPTTMKVILGLEPIKRASIVTTSINVVGQGLVYETTAYDPSTNEQLMYDLDYVTKQPLDPPTPIYVGEEINSGTS